eukprot:CAMPEP_0182857116 /NCGR_PEP_ID=MMETSP0034_2-20130328/2857_1 /TAXON_ID=156128 /ORGANISM="Nephroselmis pyriformis, Strain CCMP717" /LENGTH=771 /DNA_ID=CAMNT_0024988313 /DNA_START=61 /DNA_END=2376 /DNA_ORIENTATION=+
MSSNYRKVVSDVDVQEERHALLTRFDELAANEKVIDKNASCANQTFRFFDNLRTDDLRADYPGNLTRQKEDAYADLVEGEKVLATLDCYVRVHTRSYFQLCLFSILTCGLYLFWLLCCNCVRKKKVAQARMTIGVTNFGRLCYWHCDTRSILDSCSLGNTKEETIAETFSKWAQIKNINMVQVKYKKTILGRPLANLRIFLGKFPDVKVPPDDIITVQSPGVVMAGIESMRKRMQPTAAQNPPEDCFVKYGELVLRIYYFLLLIYDLGLVLKGMFDRSIISVIQFFFLVFQNVLTGYKLALYGRPDAFGTFEATDRCVDLFVPSFDELTKDEEGNMDPRGVYEKFMHFNKVLIETRAPKVALPNASPTPYNHFEHVDDPEDKLSLLSRVGIERRPGFENGVPPGEEGFVPKQPGDNLPQKFYKVNIDEDEVSLAEGEEVLDAYGVTREMTAADWARTIVTFGFYYLAYLRMEFKYQRAVIITNMRLIRVLRAGGNNTMVPIYNNVTYDFDMTWFCLEGLTAGMVMNVNRSVSAQVQTSAGALDINILKPKKWPWNDHRVPAKDRARMLDFLFRLSGGKAELAITDPSMIGGSTLKAVGDARLDMLPLETLPGEVVLCAHENEGLHSNKPCGSVCTKCMCCGVFPVNHDAKVHVSSHRLLAYVNQNNDPYCCPRASIEDHVWMWLPLMDPVAFQGWSLQGAVLDRNVRCCVDCFWKWNKQSTVSLDVMALNSMPIHIKSRLKGDNRGRLEDEDLRKMRKVMGAVMMGQSMSR